MAVSRIIGLTVAGAATTFISLRFLPGFICSSSWKSVFLFNFYV